MCVCVKKLEDGEASAHNHQISPPHPQARTTLRSLPCSLPQLVSTTGVHNWWCASVFGFVPLGFSPLDFSAFPSSGIENLSRCSEAALPSPVMDAACDRTAFPSNILFPHINASAFSNKSPMASSSSSCMSSNGSCNPSECADEAAAPSRRTCRFKTDFCSAFSAIT